MSKVYLGITDILTSIISKAEPTAFEKILEKTTQKKYLQPICDHLRTPGEDEASQRNTKQYLPLQSEE